MDGRRLPAGTPTVVEETGGHPGQSESIVGGTPGMSSSVGPQSVLPRLDVGVLTSSHRAPAVFSAGWPPQSAVVVGGHPGKQSLDCCLQRLIVFGRRRPISLS